MTDVYVSEHAFLGLIFATAEVYRRECYGLLFGYPLEGKVVVEGAIAYQTAERRFSEVSLYARQSRLIQRVIARFPKYEYLGEFHSHPDYRGREGLAALAEDDMTGMQPGELQLVVAVNPRRRSTPWKTTRQGALAGTLGDHHFRIGGWRVPPDAPAETARPRRVRVCCPYAVGLLGPEA